MQKRWGARPHLSRFECGSRLQRRTSEPSSCMIDLPAGRRVLSTRSITSFEGAGVISETSQMARKPAGRPNRAAEMFLTPNQLAIP